MQCSKTKRKKKLRKNKIKCKYIRSEIHGIIKKKKIQECNGIYHFFCTGMRNSTHLMSSSHFFRQKQENTHIHTHTETENWQCFSLDFKFNVKEFHCIRSDFKWLSN